MYPLMSFVRCDMLPIISQCNVPSVRDLEGRLHQVRAVHSAASLIRLRRRRGRHVLAARLLVPPRTAPSAAALQQSDGDGRVCGTRNRRRRAGPLRMAVVRHLQLDELPVGRLLQTAQQMVMLQLEDVLLAVVVVQLDAGFLGRQPRLGRLLFADERRAGGRFRDSDARQSRFLHKQIEIRHFRCGIQAIRIFSYPLRFPLVRPLVLVVDSAEIRHDYGDGQRDHQQAAQRAHAADDLARYCRRHHVTIPAKRREKREKRFSRLIFEHMLYSIVCVNIFAKCFF